MMDGPEISGYGLAWIVFYFLHVTMLSAVAIFRGKWTRLEQWACTK